MSDNLLIPKAAKLTAGLLLVLAVSACEQGASSEVAAKLDSAQSAAENLASSAAGAVEGVADSAVDTVTEAASATPSAASAQSAVSEAVAQPAAANVPALTEFAAVWGPELASAAPAINAIDQNGASQSLATLAGERGLLLVFSRSADW